MPKNSAGLLMFRFREGKMEVFLVHPGGPFWVNKDLGAWSIPKGEYLEGEEPLAAARREFEEETGFPAQDQFIPLAPRTQPHGKVISAWAFEGDADPGKIKSNTFTLEWPPNSGQHREFPEVDRAGWFTLEEGRQKIVRGQIGFLDEMDSVLRTCSPSDRGPAGESR
jgi:predicted NUDIX family NTP pyrophosphohydrolase